MTYELAKKLKDAGLVLNHNLYTHQEECLSDDVCTPSLSELIEACGKNFRLLRREELGWVAIGEISEDNYSLFKHSTPEEAVANLWLALNKQNG